MGPVHFKAVEVLEEVDHGNHGVREIGDDNQDVSAVRPAGGADSRDGDTEDEDRAKPNQPMSPQLFCRPFELVVSEMPLEIDEASCDLADKADQQETKQLVFLAYVDRVHVATTRLRRPLSDTVMYLDATM